MSDVLQRLIPASTPIRETASDDPRLGRWLAGSTMGEHVRVALVGFPSDEGVRRNGGRVGAAEGPSAIRRTLYALTPDARRPERLARVLARTVDLGDVPVTGDLEADQQCLGDVVGALLARSIVPIVLGGGHETAYGHFLGHVAQAQQVDVLNWDAHADVRPLVDGGGHSGSPFRQMREHASNLCRRYTVAGVLPWRVAASHVAYVREQGEVVWASDLDAARARSLAASLDGPTLASFDLDAVDAAPGVSAPGVGGLPVPVWLAAAEACGASTHVRSVDVVELNPRHDIDGRTATLAALTVGHVLAGIAQRDL